ncbi:hypothetical protein LOTGIDRAFT_168868 [Lottia gigantea]|uniref:Uncharacterized protein n=1 Tax=Lottia gigantea TaxID=225164 RepID=V3Z1K6_LOTGI|nr:hypothetical protein LOTGIDRAFT_168868 [Lottia gigantea]ESO84413.1 hypothetical protein LOTGIDRAFT_168868 [Lottia gigantea]
MARRFSRNIECFIGLLLIDFAFGCEDNCTKSTESIALSAILCVAAVAAIICPLLCLCGPFKRLAIRWRKYFHDNLGWEYPERGQRQCQVEYGVSTGNDVPPEYVNIAFIDLPPSYDEVVKNSQYYKYGPACSSVPAPKRHHQRQDCQERRRTETCHQISRRLEFSQERNSNSSVQEPIDQANSMNQLSSITVQDASVIRNQESEQTIHNS